jgi:hypothetical protein
MIQLIASLARSRLREAGHPRSGPWPGRSRSSGSHHTLIDRLEAIYRNYLGHQRRPLLFQPQL